MNLRNWSSEHTKGLIIGILTILVSALIVVAILAYQNGIQYSTYLNRALFKSNYTAKVISLAAIGNLPWFHFVSLKKGNWAFGQGIILATVIALITMILFKYVL